MIYTKQSFVKAWAERSKQMQALRVAGKSYAEIGKQFGVTRQRVQQICSKTNGRKPK